MSGNIWKTVDGMDERVACLSSNPVVTNLVKIDRSIDEDAKARVGDR